MARLPLSKAIAPGCAFLALLILAGHSASVVAQSTQPAGLKAGAVRTFPATVAKQRLEQAGKPAPAVRPEDEANRKVPKIIGGQDAKPGQFPWQVALIRSSAVPEDPFAGFFCGGSLVDWRWVLTAAHCTYENGPTGAVPIEANSVDVYLGSHNFAGGQRVAVKRIVRHSGYDHGNQDNDITLMELEEEPKSKQGLSRITLIKGGDDVPVQPGLFAMVLGWGSTEPGVIPTSLRESVQTLQFIDDVTFHEPATCNTEHLKYQRSSARNRLQQQGKTESEIRKQLDLWYPANSKVITGNMLCAGTNDGTKDSCFGDSGGPLIVRRGQQDVQVGVVSWGPPDGCGLTALHGVYVRLSRYQDWIAKNMR